MITKAIISSRKTHRTEAILQKDSAAIQELDLKIEFILPRGFLIIGEEKQIVKLRNKGLRVKLFPETNKSRWVFEHGSVRVAITQGSRKRQCL